MHPPPISPAEAAELRGGAGEVKRVVASDPRLVAERVGVGARREAPAKEKSPVPLEVRPENTDAVGVGMMVRDTKEASANTAPAGGPEGAPGKSNAPTGGPGGAGGRSKSSRTAVRSVPRVSKGLRRAERGVRPRGLDICAKDGSTDSETKRVEKKGEGLAKESQRLITQLTAIGCPDLGQMLTVDEVSSYDLACLLFEGAGFGVRFSWHAKASARRSPQRVREMFRNTLHAEHPLRSSLLPSALRSFS